MRGDWQARSARHPGAMRYHAETRASVRALTLRRHRQAGVKRLLVTSSLSDVRILEEVAVRLGRRKILAPVEAKSCLWSGRKFHPDDLRVCELTGLPIHFQFATASTPPSATAHGPT